MKSLYTLLKIIFRNKLNFIHPHLPQSYLRDCMKCISRPTNSRCGGPFDGCSSAHAYVFAGSLESLS